MLILNGKIFTMHGLNFEKGCVLISGNKISDVNEYIDSSQNDDGIEIDAEGCWVLPGLIDSHCHIGVSSEKTGADGDDSNEITMPITPY